MSDSFHHVHVNLSFSDAVVLEKIRKANLSFQLRWAKRCWKFSKKYCIYPRILRLQNLSLCSALRAFEQVGTFIVPHLMWHGASFVPVSSGSIKSPLTTRNGMLESYSNSDLHGSPFSRLLRHARECWEPILTWILTGLQIKKRNLREWTENIRLDCRSMLIVKSSKLTSHFIEISLSLSLHISHHAIVMYNMNLTQTQTTNFRGTCNYKALQEECQINQYYCNLHR
jgi:hypothetical protein